MLRQTSTKLGLNYLSARILPWLSRHLICNKHCYVCHQASSQLLCRYCLQDTAIAHLPVPGFDLLQREETLAHLVPPFYHHLYALAEYDGIVRTLINGLKFTNEPIAAKVLSLFFMQYVYPRIEQVGDLPQVIIPVPLSNWRYLKRGYNQARLLALALSKKSGIPMLDCLERKRHTKAQSQLDKQARLSNIEDAFSLRHKLKLEHVAVIDDVVTTGATINSVCKVLVAHHPDIRISVWAMAITPLND